MRGRDRLKSRVWAGRFGHLGCEPRGQRRLRPAARPRRRARGATRSRRNRHQSHRHQRFLRPARHQPTHQTGVAAVSHRFGHRHQSRGVARRRRLVEAGDGARRFKGCRWFQFEELGRGIARCGQPALDGRRRRSRPDRRFARSAARGFGRTAKAKLAFENREALVFALVAVRHDGAMRHSLLDQRGAPASFGARHRLGVFVQSGDSKQSRVETVGRVNHKNALAPRVARHTSSNSAPVAKARGARQCVATRDAIPAPPGTAPVGRADRPRLWAAKRLRACNPNGERCNGAANRARRAP